MPGGEPTVGIGHNANYKKKAVRKNGLQDKIHYGEKLFLSFDVIVVGA